MMQQVGQLAVRVRPLDAFDSLGRAAEAVRSSPFGAVPVIQYGCLTGMVTARILAEYLASEAGDPEQAARERTVAELPLSSGFALPDGLSLREALLFRLTWVTGYHAAEHQVVHALEAGDDLVPHVVREKPRVHPRCGTNLTVALMIISVFWYWDSLRHTLNEVGLGFGVIFAVLFVLWSWRRLGGLAQQYVTTRPATPGQIRSGIAAAEQLIADYRKNPYRSAGVFRRIWNMGLLQVLSGFALVIGVLAMLQWLRLLPPWLQVY